MVLSFQNRIIIFLATGFGMGQVTVWFVNRIKLLRLFPLQSRWTGAGLVGTLIALILVWEGLWVSEWSCLFLLVFFTLISVLVVHRADELLGTADDPRIILDEIIGFFWATAFLPLDFLNVDKRGILLFSAFLLFRIFDVLKLPLPQAEKLKGGIGIMADDLLAGLLANLLLQFTVRYIIVLK